MHISNLEDWPSRCLRPHTITAMFEQVASENLEKVALLSRRGILSYAGLNERANQLAHHLHSLGIGPESIIAVALERGIEHIVAMLASWKIGATYLPLDQSLPAKRMQYMIADSEATCLITIKGITDEKSLKLEGGITLCLDEDELIDKLRVHPSTEIILKASYDIPAYIIYTSGTTGNPKGVAITHRSVFNLVNDIRQSHEIEPSDRVLLFSPFCFDASIRDITGALMLGASLYVPEEEEILPGNLMQTIAQHAVTNSVITPSVLRACTLEDLPFFKTIVLAGEAADASLIRTWGAGRKLINAYGPTEATVCSTKRVYYDGQIPLGYSASVIGRPILNTFISIVDENSFPIKDGEVGEICITGPGVSRSGYLDMPQLNAERFGDSPFCQYRSYKTGDLGKILPNGEVECFGRKASTRQIKLNGQRIELEEVENVIRRASLVRDVVVVLPQGGAPTRSLCAYVVPTSEASNVNKQALTMQLKELMRKHLPSYSVPSSIEVINALPLSANKKLDIKALSDPGLRTDESSHSSTKTLLTSLEKKIAAELLNALHLPTEQAVSPETTYGELGGTSLQVSLVLRHLNMALGCKLHLAQFYRREVSIRHLANLIVGEQQQVNLPDDLQERTDLPRDISYSVRATPFRQQEHILLTGSTGFLGSHLLAEILRTRSPKISCIVRAPDDTIAWNRIKTALQTWNLWEDSFASRFDAFSGDICKPFLGLGTKRYLCLARKVDTVYHSAAAVSFIAPFRELEEVNITGTIEILRFASTLTQKRLNYVSTLSVFFGAGKKRLDRGMEVSVKDLHSGIVTGYAQSKWVSEQLVLEYARLGGQVLVLRPGRLLGNTQSYKCPRDDFTVRLIASILKTGVAPDLNELGLANWQIDLTPVDFCARSVHRLSLRGETGIRHIINMDTISFEAIVNSLAPSIEWMPYQQWLQLVAQSAPLAPLSSLFLDPVSSRDGRSVFEALLQMKIFRESSYDVTMFKCHDRPLPSTTKLLHEYVEGNAEIFSSMKQNALEKCKYCIDRTVGL